MAMNMWRWEDVQRRNRHQGELHPIPFTGITELPEVTYLDPEEGWKQWQRAVALQGGGEWIPTEPGALT